MTILDINLLIQRDWINRPRSKSEQALHKLNEKRCRSWSRYHKRQMRAGLEPDPLWKPRRDRPKPMTA